MLTGSLVIASVSPGLYAGNSNGAGVAAALSARVSASGAVTPLTVFTCQAGTPLSCLSMPLRLGSSTDTLYLSLYGPESAAPKPLRLTSRAKQPPCSMPGFRASTKVSTRSMSLSLVLSPAWVSAVSIWWPTARSRTWSQSTSSEPRLGGGPLLRPQSTAFARSDLAPPSFTGGHLGDCSGWIVRHSEIGEERCTVERHRIRNDKSASRRPSSERVIEEQSAEAPTPRI